MKYAFLVFSILFIQTSFAVTITSFNDSPALLNILEFIKDSASDLKISNRISEKKMIIADPAKCVQAKAPVVLNEIEGAIQNVLRYYPDEELPIDEAYDDLITLLGSHNFKKCTFYYANEKIKMKTVYFENAADSVHIKVDTITLLTE
jgi:hypothetical protein